MDAGREWNRGSRSELWEQDVLPCLWERQIEHNESQQIAYKSGYSDII